MDSDVRQLLVAHASRLRTYEGQLDAALPRALTKVMDHLARAQDSGSDRGMGSYHLVHGWGASYPETTGYIIPTMLAVGDRTGRKELRSRALEAADWLVGIQHKEGGWQGGRVGEVRPPVVFNTAQVIRGMMAAEDATGSERYRDAAIRACDWIVEVQEPDGSWARHNFLGERRVYDTYVGAPLLHMAERTGNGSYRTAALRNLEWVLSRQATNGWFADADNTRKHNDRPITHTMAYTIDGLIECHMHSGDTRYLKAAELPARLLLDRFMQNGVLNGRYDAQWHGSEAAITTGCAQLAIAWARLHALTGDVAWQEGSVRMVRWLLAVQALSFKGPGDVHGAVTGSFPLWGRYEKFACPNWAQKYLADALLCAEGCLPRY
jgi:hypothetical protein